MWKADPSMFTYYVFFLCSIYVNVFSIQKLNKVLKQRLYGLLNHVFGSNLSHPYNMKCLLMLLSKMTLLHYKCENTLKKDIIRKHFMERLY